MPADPFTINTIEEGRAFIEGAWAAYSMLPEPNENLQADIEELERGLFPDDTES